MRSPARPIAAITPPARRLLGAVALLLCAALLAPGAAQAQNRFWMVNDSGRVIERAFVSSARVADWGSDILGTSVLPPGQRVWVTPNFGDCVLDIRVTFADGGEATRMGVNACSLSQVVFGRPGPAPPPGAGAGATVAPDRTAAGDPSFNLVNGTGLTIREVYVSLTSEPNWGDDRLGANVLQPGQRLPVGLPAAGICTVDLRVVYADGRSAERRGVETCSLSDFVWR